MNFLNPFYLFGLLAVVIPIIIHLINLRRPKKVAFSTLSFFNELRKSTIRRIRIKQYLLMALRALALLFLALALARPFLPPTLTGSASSNESRAIAILIDNSASMNRVGSKGPLIDQAKEVAARIIENANFGDKFLITTTNEGQGTEAVFAQAQPARESIENVTIHNTGHYTKEQFNKALEYLQNTAQPQAVLYVISDGQESQLKTLGELELQEEGGSNAKPVSVQLIKLEQTSQSNTAVSSISLESQMLSPGSAISLSVEVENTGNVAVENQFVSLEVEDELSGQYKVGLQPGEAKKLMFEIVPKAVGSLAGRIILEGDEVGFDNTRHFVIQVPQKRSILLLNSGKSSSFTSYLEPVLQAARQTNAQLLFQEKKPSEVNPSTWQQYDAIILDGLEQIPEYWFQELQQFVQQGKGVLFFPSEQGNMENYNSFFTLFNAGRFNNVLGEYGSFKPVVKMAGIEEGHPVLNELFTKNDDEEIRLQSPAIFYYYRYNPPSNSGTLTILETVNQEPLLSEQKFGEGVLLISTTGSDPGWSNFPVNPFFAPLYYRSMLYASSSDNGGLRQHELGSIFKWEGRMQAPEATLRLNNTEFKPDLEQRAEGIRLFYEGREWEPGVLTVETAGERYKVAVNQNIMESRFGTLENSQWQKLMGQKLNVSEILNADALSDEALKEKLNTAVFGKEIWNWFVWLALLFLIAETVVSRLYKAESIS